MRGMVTMQHRMVTTLIALAYDALRLYICAIWLIVEAEGAHAASSVMSKTFSPLGARLAKGVNLRMARPMRGSAISRMIAAKGRRLNESSSRKFTPAIIMPVTIIADGPIIEPTELMASCTGSGRRKPVINNNRPI